MWRQARYEVGVVRMLLQLLYVCVYIYIYMCVCVYVYIMFLQTYLTLYASMRNRKQYNSHKTSTVNLHHCLYYIPVYIYIHIYLFVYTYLDTYIYISK